MKKVSKNLFILGAICLGLTACNSGGSDDKTCKVDFSSLGEIVKSINVQYGKRITEKIEDPVGPTVSYKFKGWYEDEKAESKKWSFETDIVKNDLTLYAGWTILSSSPSNIASGKEAFSSDITWMQQGFDSSSSLYVKIYKVLSEKNDEEENVTKTYGEEQLIEGKTSYDDENSVVTFVPDVIPQCGEYKVAIKYGTLEEVVAENFFFKGEGSEQNPYLITDENDFKAITSAESATSVGLNKYYSLYKDIAVEGDYQSEKNVTFEGTFFGNNKKITVSGNCGAFGVIGQNGSVSDVTIAGEISTASWPYIGALANTNRGKVTKVISNASVTSSAGEVKSLETEQDGGAGGIVGINEETGVIENVLFSNSSGDSSTGVVIIRMEYDLVKDAKGIFISLGDAYKVKYVISDNLYEMATTYGITISGKHASRASYLSIEKQKGTTVGHIYEYTTYQDSDMIKACADFYVKDGYVSVVGNKSSGMIGFSGFINELYLANEGRLLGYEVREEMTVAGIKGTYNTLWFNLWDIKGINTVKVLDKSDSNKSEKSTVDVYLNGSSSLLKPTYNSKLTIKTSRKYDIEYRSRYYYTYDLENEKYIANEVKVPMMFIQEGDNFNSFETDIKNDNKLDASVQLSKIYLNKILDDYDTLIDIFIQNKDNMSSEMIISYLEQYEG